MEEEIKNKINAIKSWLGSGSINIFGLPFSGKDTHGSELSSFLEGPLIGGGDILRSSAATTTSVLKEMNKGNLAPTEEYKQIVLPFLQQEKYSGIPLVLSSVGRWIGEEKSVIEACAQAKHPIKAVVFLDIPESEVLTRWKENKRERHDDASAQILGQRLMEFKTKTLPVINAYQEMGLLIHIDATPSIPIVTATLIERLYSLASSKRN